MKIYFLTQSDLDSLKVNVEANLEFYKEENNQWIHQQLEHNPFIEFSKDVDDCIMDPLAKEIENSKIIYNALKNLTDSEATDERLWAGLTHSIYWDFMRKNIANDIENNKRIKLNTNTLLNRYFFNIKTNARKRSIYINTLSKLWWAGRLCYNEENTEDPFQYLTLFETAFSHKLINIFSSNILGNKNIRFAFFEAGLYIKSLGFEIKGDTMTPILTYLNEIGGKIVIDIFTQKEILEMLKGFVDGNIEEIRSR